MPVASWTFIFCAQEKKENANGQAEINDFLVMSKKKKKALSLVKILIM